MQASVSSLRLKLKTQSSFLHCLCLSPSSKPATHPWQTKASLRFQQSARGMGNLWETMGNLMPTGLTNVTDLGLNQSIHILYNQYCTSCTIICTLLLVKSYLRSPAWSLAPSWHLCRLQNSTLRQTCSGLAIVQRHSRKSFFVFLLASC